MGMYEAVRQGSIKSYDERRSRFASPQINDRAKGDDRWHHVDDHMVFFADRFGFEEIWVPTGRSGHPRMLMLRKGNIWLSAHQVELPLKAPRQADYRDALLPILPNKLVYTLEQITRMLQQDDTEYWMLTYQQTAERLPHWIELGRQEIGNDHLFYRRNIMDTLGIIHEDEEFPQFNPTDARPSFPFNLPDAGQQKSENEE